MVPSLRGKSCGIMSGNYEWELSVDYQWELSLRIMREREREREVKGAQSKPNPSPNAFPKLWDARV